jgi:hypothetical protein
VPVFCSHHLSHEIELDALPAVASITRTPNLPVCRCFFIHLGVATQYHPFALQTYFRYTATSEREEEGALSCP